MLPKNYTVKLLFVAALSSTIALSGCAGTPETDPEPDLESGVEAESSASQPCVVGTWSLDVPDYEAQSAEYLQGLGIPIEDFAMTGAGTMQFTADGLVSGEIGLTSSGTIVVDDIRVPLNVPSSYTGSGDWSPGDDDSTINFANWANVPGTDAPADPSAPPIPAIDYTDIPSVNATCTATTLVLQAPDAPLAAKWVR